MKFECPHCGQHLEGDQSIAGLKIRCPACNGPMITPSPSSADAGGHVVAKLRETLRATIGREKGATTQPTSERGGRVDCEDTAGPGPALSAERGRKYELGDVLARGGQGVIFDAKDVNVERNVALKVMIDRNHASKEQVIRFIREARVTGQLEHPGIVPLYELDIDADGNVFYTMKYVKGETLRGILDSIGAGDRAVRRDYPLSRLLTIYQKVCDAIAFAHSRGVLHRDLKPGNVMVGEYGEVLVMDWGLAKILGEPADTDETLAGSRVHLADDQAGSGSISVPPAGETVTGEVVGTPQFMAPEQAEGEIEQTDERADIYALGAMLYNILTLNPPVSGADLDEVLAKVSAGDIPHPSIYSSQRGGWHTELWGQGGEIPDSLSAVAMKALSLRLSDRYKTVQALQRDIEAYQSGFATSAEKAGALRQLWLLIGRHKAEFGVLASALAVIVALVAGFMVRVIAEEREAIRARNEALAAKAQEEQARAQADRAREEAIEAKEQIVRNAMLASQRFCGQSLRMIDEGRLREAKLRAEDAVVVCGAAPYGWYAQAMIAQSENRHKDAVALFKKSIGLDPGHSDSKLAMIKSVHALGLLAVAADTSSGATPSSEAANGLLRESSNAGSAITEVTDGMLELALLQEESVTDWRALIRYADILFELANYPEAETAYAKAMGMMATDEVASFRIQKCEAKKNVARVKALCKSWYPVRDRLAGADKGREVVRKMTSITGDTGAWQYGVEDGQLTSMILGSCSDAYSLECLRGLALKSLSVSGWSGLRDLDPLSGMPLKELRIANCPELADISGLKGMPLEIAEFTNCTQVCNLGALAGMPLKRLHIVLAKSASQNLKDVGLLAGMPIESLRLDAWALVDMSPLEGMPLKSLSICSGTLTNISALSGIRSLESLTLSARQLESMAPLTGLKLKHVDLSGCVSVTDICFVAGMPLEFLGLSGCRSLHDLSPLVGMSISDVNLGTVWGQVTDPSPVEDLPILRVRDRAASVYLRDAKYNKAERLYRSMAEKWPGSKEAFLGLRTIAQVNIQGTTPRSMIVVSSGDTEVQLRQVARTPVPGTSLEHAFELSSHMITTWPARDELAVSYLLRARIALERGDMVAAKKDFASMVKSCGQLDAGQHPSAECIAAAYVLDEVILVGGDVFVPGQSAVGGPTVAPGDTGVADSIRQVGISEVVLHITPAGVGSLGNEQATHAAAIKVELLPNAGTFFVAVRHLVAGHKDKAIVEFRKCIDLDNDSSYGQQASRILKRLTADGAGGGSPVR